MKELKDLTDEEARKLFKLPWNPVKELKEVVQQGDVDTCHVSGIR